MRSVEVKEAYLGIVMKDSTNVSGGVSQKLILI